MPHQKTKNSLQEALAQKTTRELENMLVEDFAADEEPNAEMIHSVMEVMRDRQPETEEEKKKADAAHLRFLAAIHDNSQTPSAKIVGTPKEHPLDYTCTTEQSQIPKKAFRRSLRGLLIAAIVAVLVAGTAMGRNWFSVIAQWTAETFRFDTGTRTEEMPKTTSFIKIQLSVERETDLPIVPTRAPESTEMAGSVSMTERTDNCRIRATFHVEQREFTLQYTIHDVAPDDISGTYQRDDEIKVTHEAGGIKHYITGNHDNLSVMWINGNVEGHIQGTLTLEELQGMLDSIYEE